VPHDRLHRLQQRYSRHLASALHLLQRPRLRLPRREDDGMDLEERLEIALDEAFPQQKEERETWNLNTIATGIT
jgi:hypothetical protein